MLSEEQARHAAQTAKTHSQRLRLEEALRIAEQVAGGKWRYQPGDMTIILEALRDYQALSDARS